MKQTKQNKQIISEIEKHKSNYIHIPIPSGIWYAKLFGLIVSVFLSIVNFLLIKSIWLKFNLGYVFANQEEMVNYTIKVYHLTVLYPILFEYVFIALSIIAFFSLFKKLKSFDDDGLICGLIFGLICGLIIGLICGLIFGLIGGLIGALIIGLVGEFRK